MKGIRKNAAVLRVVLTVVVIMAAYIGLTTTVSAAAKMNYTSLTLDYNVTRMLMLKDASGSVKWTNSNPSVVKLTSLGQKARITSLKKVGNATITAKDSNGTFKCKITVAKIKMEKSSMRIPTYKVASLKLLNAPGVTAQWRSSATGIARISTTYGNRIVLVAGKKTGTCNITATYSGRKYTCKITVYDDSIQGRWSGNHFIQSNGVMVRGGVFKIGGKNYVFDKAGNLVVNRWASINGYWYYGDSEGKTIVSGWRDIQGPSKSDSYWYNYGYYHGKLFFDAYGRWDMRKNSKVKWDTRYNVIDETKVKPSGNNIQQGMYRLSPKSGGVGYYQWYMKNSNKHDDCRPVYAVKGTIYIRFGAPYSIQLSNCNMELIRWVDEVPAAKQAMTGRHCIGWIGNTKIMYG